MGRRDYLSKLKYVQIPTLDSYSLVVPSAILGYFCGDMRTCSENPQMSMLAVVAVLSARSIVNFKTTPLWLSYSAPGRQCICACAEMLDVPARAEAQRILIICRRGIRVESF